MDKGNVHAINHVIVKPAQLKVLFSSIPRDTENNASICATTKACPGLGGEGIVLQHS